MSLPRFTYLAPKSLSEVVALLAERSGQARLLAGGTDLIPKMGKGSLRPGALVSLKRVDELRAITFDPEKGLVVGATARLSELVAHDAVRRFYPAMAHAASQTATVQIRNMATLAGNVCNGSPCADNVPTLVARGARAECLSARGSRFVEMESFFLAPGVIALDKDEVLARIHVPPPPRGAGFAYRCISGRSKVDISAVSVGAKLALEGSRIAEARVVLGAVGPTPLRARKAEALLAGEAPGDGLFAAAGEAAAEEARPISDVRASAAWRRKMVAVLVKRALAEAAARAEAAS